MVRARQLRASMYEQRAGLARNRERKVFQIVVEIEVIRFALHPEFALLSGKHGDGRARGR
jgi:hypothetical protein